MENLGSASGAERAVPANELKTRIYESAASSNSSIFV
jgi:hypothetical protein